MNAVIVPEPIFAANCNAMSELFWVSMPIIRNIVISSARTPAELSSICESGGITVADLDTTDMRLTLEQNCKLMAAAQNISGDAFMGLHIGEKTTPVVLGIAGHLVETSRDVLTALYTLPQFTSTFTRLFAFDVQVSAGEVMYYCEPIGVWNELSPETAQQSVDICFAAALHIIRLLTGRHIRPRRVRYRYNRINNTGEYERVLKVLPEFNADANCIHFDIRDMQRRVIGYNKELNVVYKKMLTDKLGETSSQNFGQRIRQLISHEFNLQFPQLHEIAAMMHVTPRTLQRKLKEENTSFRELSDEIRLELARRLLSQTSFTVTEIAYKLGYKDPSTFQRAFRQWTGKTPRSFRVGGSRLEGVAR